LKEKYPGSTIINSSSRDERISACDYLRIKGLTNKVSPSPRSIEFILWQFHKRVLGLKFYFEKFLKNVDYVLSLGGDNFTLDYGTPDQYFCACDLVGKKGKRLIIWGCSVGPFSESPELEKRYAVQLKNAYKVVARESETVKYLNSIGVCENVILRPDPAFSLGVMPCSLTESEQQILDQGCLGLNLSPLLGKYRQGDWFQTAKHWVECLLAKIDLPILFVPHVMQVGNDDYSFMKRIVDEINNKERIGIIQNDLSSCEYKYIISKTKVFAGARTHATIAALSSCVPTFSIGYSMKSRGINIDIFGNLNWVVDHRELNSTSFVDKVKDLITNETETRKYLEGIMPEYKKFNLDFL
jgi:polysaccharide pyruvyl transferase WcaK-like protein